MARERGWDEEETIILVYEYFKNIGETHSNIKGMCHNISVFLRNREEYLTGKPVSEIFRNDAGIYMQWQRIRCLDPSTDYTGMKGTELQIKIFDEFKKDPRRMEERANNIYKKYC